MRYAARLGGWATRHGVRADMLEGRAIRWATPARACGLNTRTPGFPAANVRVRQIRSSSVAATAGETNQFSAAGSALGYHAQVDYALLLAVSQDADILGELSLETLDDVVFHGIDGSADELLQTKHHLNRSASLTNASVDLWKTLANWVTAGAAGRLVLLTTSVASDDTAAHHLRQSDVRDIDSAVRILEMTARESTNQDNHERYRLFLDLSPAERRSLVERVYVIDAAPAAVAISEELSRQLQWAAPARRRTALVERLLGWWHQRAIGHLTSVAQGLPDRIAVSEIQSKVHGINQTLRDDDLPIDFETMDRPGVDEVAADDRVFVQQLRLIALGNKRLRQCIYDHNRAYEQRSRWQREELLDLGELEGYDARLVDEWRRHFTPLTDDRPDGDEALMQARARELFASLDSSPLPPVRPRVSAGFVANGSLHMLADRLRIGWHPQWIERLRHLLRNVPGAGEEVA